MEFQEYQRRFTAHLRDPAGQPRPPGAAPARMKVYNRLLFNNVEAFLLACFPVCRQVLGARRWRRLVRAFFRDHACLSPYFREIPEEFLSFLQDRFESPADGPDFLPELAHHEWVELALETSNRDALLPVYDPRGDLLAGRPLLNPVLMLSAYRYPVHRLGPRHRPHTPPGQPTFVLAYRVPDTLAIRFQETNALTARLVDHLLAGDTRTGFQVLSDLARESGCQLTPEFMQAGRSILDGFREDGIVLGSRL